MASREILTGITYYQYHVVAAITFGGYSAYHYLNGNLYICASTGLASISIMGLVVSRILNRDSEFLRSAILVSIILAVFSACYFLGLRGVVWLFPLVAGIFFNYEKKVALLVSLFSVLTGLIMATNIIEPVMALRMMFPLAFTIGFAYLYRMTIEREQVALEKEASEDYLTGIFNRRSFQRWLQRAIGASQYREEYLAIFYLDIDDFKQINDTYGHDIGDLILQEFSCRLVDTIRQTDAVASVGGHQLARIAGDEFVIAAAGLSLEQHADTIATRLLAAIDKPVFISGIEFKLTTSIGVALNKSRKVSADALLREADAAMYRSKQNGKNRITYFDQDIAQQIKEKQRIARGIEEALRKQEFFLNLMPIYKLLDDGQQRLAGAEVLVRSNSEALSGLGPDKYIPIAEEYGSIKDIDLYVINRAFERLSEIRDKLPTNFILAINISAKELQNESFAEQVARLAGEHDIPCSMVELELTETSLVQHDEKSIAVLKKLKRKGFHLALDDFGTGYTAFSQLQAYPVDTLKIDRSFVWSIGEPDQRQALMVDVILSLAKLYEVKIVAEGVENEQQLDYLRKSNCDYVQGYYLCKPLSWELFCQRFIEGMKGDEAKPPVT